MNDENSNIVAEGPKLSPQSHNEWVISMRGKFDHVNLDAEERKWSNICIYRVPHYLQESDNKAYHPQIVSLGPYHHNNERLRNMDPHKRRAVKHILKRTDQGIELYLDAIKQLEEKARACYEGPIDLSSNEFVEMMVLDGCFILEIFRGADEGFLHLGYSGKDPIFAISGTMHSIQRDMIMLENQIPLFILHELFGLQSNSADPDPEATVRKLALSFFDPLTPNDEPLIKSNRNKLKSSISFFFRLNSKRNKLKLLFVRQKSNRNELKLLFFRLLRTSFFGADLALDPQADLALDPQADIRQGGLHCLDVFRKNLLGSSGQSTPKISANGELNPKGLADKRRQQLIRCVTELRESGIKFKKRKTDTFWDVKFKNGVLKIPRILIHDGTKSLFLNLIALEQCDLQCSNHITAYVVFMDNLINSPEDVSFLQYYGIIEHWLGSNEEVADLFNRLGREVVFDRNNCYLFRLSEHVNRYCDHRWNTWRATLTHKYFNSPWAIVSFIAAVVLLLLTAAQTFYGVYGYYRPKS